MEKPVRYGLLLLVVLMISFSVLPGGSQIVYANDEQVVTEDGYTPAEKAAAIKAANDAILRIPQLQYIVALDQAAVAYVIEARILVEIAKEHYDAIDSDFPGLPTLIEAGKRVAKLLAVKAAQDAIDAIPLDSELTDEYREAVLEARRLLDIAMQEHGATYFDICWRYDALRDAEDRLDEEEPEPEPVPAKPDDRLPTPSTGGFSIALGMGLFISGIGMLFVRQRQNGRR